MLGVDDYQCLPLGYPCGQCTSFVAWRIRNDLGLPGFTPAYGGGFWGNASTWAYAAVRAGVPIDGEPRIGDVVVFGPEVEGAGAYGHVAVVLHVLADSVIVEDYNWTDNGTYSHHVVPLAGLQFVHFNPQEEPPMDYAILSRSDASPDPHGPGAQYFCEVARRGANVIPGIRRYISDTVSLNFYLGAGMRLEKCPGALLDRALEGPVVASGSYPPEP